MHEFKSAVRNRFDSVDAILKGLGSQFELTNEARINDVNFIVDKVHKIEKELYILKNKDNN
ncbi:hypothetical protein GCM10008986_09060 [Salinibacillus aidingensis]|uniref:Spo0E like sporulation regulatory protein n=1 Tax=Salinibacillus aidingensis TaxID=237684 RepID=A0ABN1AY36_9BACI